MIKRAFALFIGLLVLIGSVGISADFHICQNKIKSVCFFGDAKKCSSLEVDFVCKTNDSKPKVEKKKCCSNESIYSTASFQSEVSSVVCQNPIFKKHVPLAKGSSLMKKPLCSWTDYKIPEPPLIEIRESLEVAYQSFLI